jgi:hypothetical protein
LGMRLSPVFRAGVKANGRLPPLTFGFAGDAEFPDDLKPVFLGVSFRPYSATSHKAANVLRGSGSAEAGASSVAPKARP